MYHKISKSISSHCLCAFCKVIYFFHIYRKIHLLYVTVYSLSLKRHAHGPPTVSSLNIWWCILYTKLTGFAIFCEYEHKLYQSLKQPLFARLVTSNLWIILIDLLHCICVLWFQLFLWNGTNLQCCPVMFSAIFFCTIIHRAMTLFFFSMLVYYFGIINLPLNGTYTQQ